jgi:hypothetical protein
MQQAESAQTLGGKLARRLESRMTIEGGFTFLAYVFARLQSEMREG